MIFFLISLLMTYYKCEALVYRHVIQLMECVTTSTCRSHNLIGKLSLYLTKHHAMTYWGVEV
jgi:hypothetical protein